MTSIGATGTGVRETAFQLQGGAGRLSCRAALPEGVPRARLVLVHGYGEHSGRYREVMQWLAARGIACIAPDLRGQGLSSGRRGFTRRWEEYIEDLKDLLACPECMPDSEAPLFLLGHSHGALVAAVALEDEPDLVQGCVLSAPFFAARFEVPAWKKSLARLLAPVLPWMPIPTGLSDDAMTSDPEMRADSRGDPLIVRSATPSWFGGMLVAQARVIAQAESFTTPLLMLLAEEDTVSDPDAARAFYEKCGSCRRELVIVKGARHEILREVGRQETFAVILDWIERRGARPSLPCAAAGG